MLWQTGLEKPSNMLPNIYPWIELALNKMQIHSEHIFYSLIMQNIILFKGQLLYKYELI